jgi:hypothetical protein
MQTAHARTARQSLVSPVEPVHGGVGRMRGTFDMMPFAVGLASALMPPNLACPACQGQRLIARRATDPVLLRCGCLSSR